ncbi:MAG: FAD-linked oxidase C-terminal domain-containing protein [Bacillota bacterium]|nr:FAD-linked oxidase C-terminal domain-containing protein [Bacillota bacterium]
MVVTDVRPAPARAAGWLERLRGELPRDRLLTRPGELAVYAYDATGEIRMPDAVFLPEREEEVLQVLQLSQRLGFPVIARGAGSNISGGTIPRQGGLVLAFNRMRSVLWVDPDRLRARVQPGIPNLALQEAIRPYGLFYAPDPSSHRVSTLGGNVNENAGGPRCVKYGVTTRHVVGLRALLADGRALELRREDGGLDLRGLVVGSEGTLAVVTEVEVALTPFPPREITLLAAYESIEAALAGVSAIIAAGVVPASLELLDRASIETVQPFVHGAYPEEAGAVLLIDLNGTERHVEAELERVQELLRRGGAEWRLAESDEEREALWLGRRAAFGAAARVSRHVWTQDVTVPRPRLVEMMRRVEEIAGRYGLTILTVAHAGDGNLHPLVTFDPSDPDSVRRMHEADDQILAACARMGGSITGEHGIGVDKLPNLGLMYSLPELERMRRLKLAFDPEERLNPGKAVPDAAGLARIQAGEWPGREPLEASAFSERFGGALARWREGGTPVLLQGGGRLLAALAGAEPPAGEGGQRFELRAPRGIEVDPENLTAEVGAGTSPAELREALAAAGLRYPADEGDGLASTLGGHLASGVGGPLAALRGGPRDWVLGLVVVDGEGERLWLGGRSVKNVAGYDLVRLLVGSWGALGAIERAVLRLEPRPEVRRSWLLPLPAGAQPPTPRSVAELGLSVAEVLPGGDGGEGRLLWLVWEGLAVEADAQAARLVEELRRSGLLAPGALPEERPYEEVLPLWRRARAAALASARPALDPARRELEERVRRAFDPLGLFCTPRRGDDR